LGVCSYEAFHTIQTDIVAEYPHMVHEELTRYDESVCTFFTVNRNKPKVCDILKCMTVAKILTTGIDKFIVHKFAVVY